MKRIAQSVAELIGNTPMVQLNRIVPKGSAIVIAKLEMFNPGASVKDRIALNMIEQAEKNGLVNEETVIIEATSGNTGIGLAMVGAAKGRRIVLVMPENMSEERIHILKSFGAKVILTPVKKGMQGAVDRARELVTEEKSAFMPSQFSNPANPDMHKKTTAKEILSDTDGHVDAFVAGIGTGGTITGVGEALKKHNASIQIIGVEPESSAVLSGQKPGPHMIQGIGAGFVPDVLNKDVIDKILQVSDEDAYDMASQLAKSEGIFAGISSGAACYAGLQVAKDLGEGKQVIVVFPDSGERYLSMIQYFKG